MPLHSLKFKIAANLAVILLITTLLSYFVVMHIIQKNLIQSGVAQGRRLMAQWPEPPLGGGAVDVSQWQSVMDTQRLGSPYIYAAFYRVAGKGYDSGVIPDDLKRPLHIEMAKVIQTREPHTQFYGDTWGVFWRQSQYILISNPVKDGSGRISGVKTMIFQLDDIYRLLRQSQKIIGWYMAANFFMLLFIGTYRLSRLVLRPIRKFIRMTDDYRDKDRLYFTPGRKYQEFNQLSKALNQMIEKIEKNKEKLQNAFNRLELANRELKTAQDEIIKAEKLASIGRLSAGIAHEIGNPIGIVLGYIDLLKSRPGLKTDDTAQDYLFRAADEIERVHGVIRQLLDFSRSAPLNLQCIGMHDLVKDVAAIMSHQPLMSDIDIECRLSAEADTVFADYDRMRQVLVNLVINAADAIHGAPHAAKGKIIFETASVRGDDQRALSGHPALVLQVTDNGAGIAKQDMEAIFDPFYTTKEPGKGTGLGLSVSYMIIEQTGGTISVESETGRGTTMTVSLPLHMGKGVLDGKTHSDHR